MRTSLILIGCFAAGILAGYTGSLPGAWVAGNVELFILCGLLVFVGIGVGCDTEGLRGILRLNAYGLAVPLLVAAGSLAGAGAVAAALSGLDLRQGMAVGAGFGYYSLSSILIKQISGEELGAVALLSNVFREVLTILLVPWLARYGGKLAPIACGGATSMDTTLPVIHRYVGTRYAVISVTSGAVLSMLVPVLVPLLLS
jgi:uncharacterized membrane protein YbjE (DUF340 family)